MLKVQLAALLTSTTYRQYMSLLEPHWTELLLFGLKLYWWQSRIYFLLYSQSFGKQKAKKYTQNCRAAQSLKTEWELVYQDPLHKKKPHFTCTKNITKQPNQRNCPQTDRSATTTSSSRVQNCKFLPCTFMKWPCEPATYQGATLPSPSDSWETLQ